jgi:hypothetical protein
MNSFHSVVMRDHHLWVIAFHDSSDASVQFLSSEFALASSQLRRYGVRVGALDCTSDTAKKAARKLGIAAFPTVVSVNGKSELNPYTKKHMRTVRAMKERTAKKFKKWATRGKGAKLPSFVSELDGANVTALGRFGKGLHARGLHGAVLVKGKAAAGVSPVLRGLSADLKDRLEIAQIGALGQDVAAALGVVLAPEKPEEEEEEEEEEDGDGDGDDDDQEEIDLDADTAAAAVAKKKREAAAAARAKAYAAALANATPLPALFIVKGKADEDAADTGGGGGGGGGVDVVTAFDGDLSDRDAIFAFLNARATKKPVPALDAEPVPLGWTEITSAKEYRRLLGASDDVGGRESGWLVAFHRDGEPDLKAGHGKAEEEEEEEAEEEEETGGDGDTGDGDDDASHDWNAEIVPSITKTGVLRAATVDCSSSNAAAATPIAEGGLKEHCDAAFSADHQAVGKKKKRKKKKKKKQHAAAAATLVVRSFPHPGSVSSGASSASSSSSSSLTWDASAHLGEDAALLAMEHAVTSLVMTIPNRVVGVAPHSPAVDQAMVAAVNSNRMVAFYVDDGSEDDMPPSVRALAYAFEQHLVIGYLSTTDKALLDRFQIKNIHAHECNCHLVVMFQQPDPEQEKKMEEARKQGPEAVKKAEAQRNVQFGLAPYDAEAMGAPAYGNAGAWLQNVIQQVRPEGLPDETGDKFKHQGFGGGRRKASSSSSSSSSSASNARRQLEEELAGPVKEIADAATFDALCPRRNRLCAVALVDGAAYAAQSKDAAEGTTAASLEMARAKEHGQLAYSVLDGICHADLAAHLLGVSDVMEVPGRLPTMVVLSRSKGRRAELVGDVNEFESVVSFVRAVKRGQRRTMGLSSSAKKAIQAEEGSAGAAALFPNAGKCDDVHAARAAEIAAAAAADEEDDTDMADMLAEIRAEEEKEAREREERAAEEKQKEKDEEAEKKRAVKEEETAKWKAKRKKKKKKKKKGKKKKGKKKKGKKKEEL